MICLKYTFAVGTTTLPSVQTPSTTPLSGPPSGSTSTPQGTTTPISMLTVFWSFHVQYLIYLCAMAIFAIQYNIIKNIYLRIKLVRRYSSKVVDLRLEKNPFFIICALFGIESKIHNQCKLKRNPSYC